MTPADSQTVLLDELVNEQGVDQLTASQMIWAPHLVFDLGSPRAGHAPTHAAPAEPSPVTTTSPTTSPGGTMLDRFLTWLLGPRCPFGCGQRLYPRDRACHYAIDHAGDPGSLS